MGTKISALTAVTTPADGDLIPVVDVSDTAQATTGSTRKITRANLISTSTPAELNILDGATLSTAELNILDGVTSTAAELNYIDGSTVGTAVASKAAVLGANKELDEFHTAAFYLGSGAGTQVTATATELNIIDGVTASTNDLTATTNFEETVSATTSEVTITATKTLNVATAGNFKMGGTAVSSTATELNITDGGETAEKVLNTQTKASAYLTANQLNLTSGTPTKVNCNAESYDVGSDYDHATNYKFVTPVAGYYLIIGNIQWLGSSMVADKAYSVIIYVNGAAVKYDYKHASFVGSMNTKAATTQYVAATTDIELYARQDSGANTVDINGGLAAETSLEIHLLSI